MPDYRRVANPAPKSLFSSESATAAVRKRWRDARQQEREGVTVNWPKASVLGARMREILSRLANNPEAIEVDILTRSYARLFQPWAHLVGLPGPGQRQPSRERPAKATLEIAPIGPEVQPEPITHAHEETPAVPEPTSDSATVSQTADNPPKTEQTDKPAV